jgi:pyruvate/2-oxoglutarate/acetoin dehydrogenase E1 component
VSAVTYSYMTGVVLEAADILRAEGIEVEVIDLRTLDNLGLDYSAIGNSLDRTGALVTVEQSPRSHSIGARIAGECERRFFDSLDGPTVSVTGEDVPLPVSKRLEAAATPGVARITDVLRLAAGRQV